MSSTSTGRDDERALVAKSMKETIFDELRSDIASGALAPGVKLSEARIAARFGTSRMPVREAFQALARADLVVVEQRRGTFVRRVSEREMIDLYEVREAIESLAARLSAQRATGETLELLDAELAAMKLAVESGDAQSFIVHDERLHELIFEGTANPRLVDHYTLLSGRMHRAYLSTLVTQRPGRLARSYQEHVDIVDAIRVRDFERAEISMRRHVQQGGHELGMSISEREAN